jgi:hypothetical protein
VVNQIVIVPIGGESSKRGAAFGTGVTSGTRLSVVRTVWEFRPTQTAYAVRYRIGVNRELSSKPL